MKSQTILIVLLLFVGLACLAVGAYPLMVRSTQTPMQFEANKKFNPNPNSTTDCKTKSTRTDDGGIIKVEYFADCKQPFVIGEFPAGSTITHTSGLIKPNPPNPPGVYKPGLRGYSLNLNSEIGKAWHSVALYPDLPIHSVVVFVDGKPYLFSGYENASLTLGDAASGDEVEIAIGYNDDKDTNWPLFHKGNSKFEIK